MTTPNSARAQEILTNLLARLGKGQNADTPVTADTGLYGDGLQLDSLEVAELSVLLEDELGSDPFSDSDPLPQKVGDVLAFYRA